MLSWLGPLAGIILVDLVLSGDNALVIGAAASKLPGRQRLLALLLGGGGAIVLRIAFAVIASLLLQVPLLKAIGGGLLLLIAVRLLIDRQSEPGAEGATKEQTGDAGLEPGFLSALLTIVIADISMSLDNILAVGALADGSFIILALGLILSIVGMLVLSALISSLINRLPWLLDLAALVLSWTAIHMILEDGTLSPVLSQLSWSSTVLPMITIALVVLVDVASWRRRYLARCNQRDDRFETAGEVYERLPRWKRRICDLVGILPVIGGGLLLILLKWWR